jgi:hypothetical protein
MTTKEVLQSECDQCGKKEVFEPGPGRRAQILLPQGWLHVSGKTKSVDVFSMDLCDTCVAPVLAMAGKHKVPTAKPAPARAQTKAQKEEAENG